MKVPPTYNRVEWKFHNDKNEKLKDKLRTIDNINGNRKLAYKLISRRDRNLSQNKSLNKIGSQNRYKEG